MSNPHDQLDEEWRNAIVLDNLRDERREKRAATVTRPKENTIGLPGEGVRGMSTAKWEETRVGATGQPFGNYYRVHCTLAGTRHELRLFADKFEVDGTGNLLLYDRDGQEAYRAFAAGSWQEICGASCFDGSEVNEAHDLAEIPHR
jgi:hypothetical protein